MAYSPYVDVCTCDLLNLCKIWYRRHRRVSMWVARLLPDRIARACVVLAWAEAAKGKKWGEANSMECCDVLLRAER
jgi:hypothetical protein